GMVPPAGGTRGLAPRRGAMNRPIAARAGAARTRCAAVLLWLVVASLPLLNACGQPGGAVSPAASVSAPPAASASASSASGSRDVAFVYAYYEGGVAGLAGGSARDGSVVWRAAIGSANWAPTIVGDTVYACVHVHAPGSSSQNVVAVHVATGQVRWT